MHVVVDLIALLAVVIAVAGAARRWQLPAPPDAVAATAIARRAGLPRVALTILEGESLFNDATALVCLRAATAAIIGTVTAAEVVLDFGISAVGGVAAGVAVALVVRLVRKHVDDTLTDTPSRSSRRSSPTSWPRRSASGVLAVVVTGVLLGHKAMVLQSASSRLFERTNWATIQFLLENADFLLIGLQVRTILTNVEPSSLGAGRIALATVAVFAAVLLIRPLGVFATAYIRPLQRRRHPDAPRREVLVLIALTVTIGTLLVQGFSLRLVIRRLGLSGPDPDEDALQAAEIYERAASAGRDRLVELDTADVPDEVVTRLGERSVERAHSVWERLGGGDETPSQAYARLRTEVLAAERAEVLRIRATGNAAHEVLQDVLAALDVEETILARAEAQTTAERDIDLRPALGLTWVHLCLCLECGHVGCCDSSPQRHATHHHEDTGHPVIRSFEIGEARRWCYVDEQTG